MPPAMKREVAGSLAKSEEGEPIPRRRSAPVDQLPELFAGLEVRDLLGRHHDSGPRLGVAPGPTVAPADPEAAEAAELDLVALLEGVDDGGEDGLDDDLRVLAGDVRGFPDLVHQLCLGHRLLLFRLLPRGRG